MNNFMGGNEQDRRPIRFPQPNIDFCNPQSYFHIQQAQNNVVLEFKKKIVRKLYFRRWRSVKILTIIYYRLKMSQLSYSNIPKKLAYLVLCLFIYAHLCLAFHVCQNCPSSFLNLQFAPSRLVYSDF